MSSGSQTYDQCSYCPHLVNHTLNKHGEWAELSRVYIKHTAVSSRFTLVLNESQEVFVVAAFCSQRFSNLTLTQQALCGSFYRNGFAHKLVNDRCCCVFEGGSTCWHIHSSWDVLGLPRLATRFTSWLIVDQYLLNVNDSRHPDLIWWTAWAWGDCPHDWDVVKEWIYPLHDFIPEFRPSQMSKAPVHSLITCCLNAALSKLMLLLLHE